MVESEVIEREKSSALLIHPDYEGRVTIDWFDPKCRRGLAQPVTSGGRGGAWFIDAGDSRLVLREYRRGGLAAKLSQNVYAYTREQDVRSFSEFRLLNRLKGMGLPVPKAVAAWYRKLSPLHYRASIIIERLDDSLPLAELLADLREADWYELGQTIRCFHDAGVRHADLNCFNVLVKAGDFYLIDFDKGQIMSPGASISWKHANLERLARSLTKIADKALQRAVWGSFMDGYNGSDFA